MVVSQFERLFHLAAPLIDRWRHAITSGFPCEVSPFYCDNLPTGWPCFNRGSRALPPTYIKPTPGEWLLLAKPHLGEGSSLSEEYIWHETLEGASTIRTRESPANHCLSSLISKSIPSEAEWSIWCRRKTGSMSELEGQHWSNAIVLCLSYNRRSLEVST